MTKKLLVAVFLCLCLFNAGAQGHRVVFIGDSITDGDWGKADGKPSEQRSQTDMNHIFGHSYMADCASYYLAKYPLRRYVFWNRGVSGDTLEKLEKRWDSDVIALNPDIVSVYVGINDAYADPSGVDFKAWEAKYRSLLDRTLAACPGVKFVMCTPYVMEIGGVGRRKDFPEMKSTVETLASIVRKIASDYDAVLVPFDSLMQKLVSSSAGSDEHYWCWDGIHPTYAAHLKFSELWIRNCRKIMK